MTKHRIKQGKTPNGTDWFLVEEKGWFFWSCVFYEHHPPGITVKVYFNSLEEAKYQLEQHLLRKKNAKTKPKIVWEGNL